MIRDSAMLERALFLDRDGVINEEVGYLIQPADVRFVSGIASLCRTAQRLGYRLVVVTNQSGIARGLYGEVEFEALMTWMREALGREGVHLDAVYYCPYHPEHGIGRYRQEHADRKPSPGMLRRASADLGLSLQDSVMVGDRCSDVGAANAAGLRLAFLLEGTEEGPCTGRYQAIRSLGELEQWLIEDAKGR